VSELEKYSHIGNVVLRGPIIKIANMTVVTSPGISRRIRLIRKSDTHLDLKKDAVTRYPLITKKIETASPPPLSKPVRRSRGSA
jgi:hypothetical protein